MMLLLPENTCRICLENPPSNELCNIFEEIEPIYPLIMICTAVKIEPDDGLPSTICQKCLINLNAALRFKLQCESADYYLHQLMSSSKAEHPNSNLSYVDINVKLPKPNSDFFYCQANNLAMYQCKDCTFTTAFLIVLKKHQLTHSDEVKEAGISATEYDVNHYTCNSCYFQTYSSLKSLNHMKKHCFLRDDPVLKRSENMLLLRCKQCSFETTDLKYLRTHENGKHNGRKYSKIRINDEDYYCCDACCYKSKQVCSIKKHERMQHLPGPETKWFKCEQCPYKTSYQGTFKRHVTHKHKWFDCDSCASRFISKRELTLHHKRVHVKREYKKWFTCKHCPFNVKYYSLLKDHEICTHSDIVKWFDCPECTSKFKTRSGLLQHKSHAHVDKDPKWYECDKCTSQFKTRTALKLHKTHVHVDESNIMRFECRLCPYKARSKKYMMAHNLRLHDVHLNE